MCNDTGRSPRCEASGNRFLPANISGAIWRFMHGLGSRKRHRGSRFRAVERHGCAGPWLQASVLQQC